MKAMLPFYGMGLLAVAMAATTRGQPAISVQTLEKDQPKTERSQAATKNKPLKADTKPVLKTQSDGSLFDGMSDQAIANQIAADLGVKNPPTVTYACSFNGQSDFAGLANYSGNKLVICPSGNPDAANKKFTIAHEIGHFLQYQQNPNATNKEQFADRTAIDYFKQRGYLEPVKAKAEIKGKGAEGDYKPGKVYANQVLKEQGK